jgi:hypothetical protein
MLACTHWNKLMAQNREVVRTKKYISKATGKEAIKKLKAKADFTWKKEIFESAQIFRAAQVEETQESEEEDGRPELFDLPLESLEENEFETDEIDELDG